MNPVTLTSSPSILVALNSHIELPEGEFFKKFGTGKAIRISTDEIESIDSSTQFSSITSFEIGDCITIFLVEKNNQLDSKNESVLAYHVSVDTDKIDVELVPYIDNKKFYEIYLVGGNKTTTQEDQCLLQEIKRELQTIFKNNYIIKKELVNLNAKTSFEYISANMRLDGTLTICRHNA